MWVWLYQFLGSLFILIVLITNSFVLFLDNVLSAFWRLCFKGFLYTMKMQIIKDSLKRQSLILFIKCSSFAARLEPTNRNSKETKMSFQLFMHVVLYLPHRHTQILQSWCNALLADGTMLISFILLYILLLIQEWISQPRWLSWMRRPTGDQEVAGSTPAGVDNILSWRLITKYFLRSFSPFRWFKKGSCQFLAKECAQYWLTA